MYFYLVIFVIISNGRTEYKNVHPKGIGQDKLVPGITADAFQSLLHRNIHSNPLHLY